MNYYTQRLAGHIRAFARRLRFGKMGKKVVFGKHLTLIGCKRIELGYAVSLGDFTSISTWGTGRLEIGDYASIGRLCHITAFDRIQIGNHVLLGEMITITDNSHGDSTDLLTPPLKRPLTSKGPVTIEDKVWIGDKATILPGVHIGEGAVVGANSVVTHDVPAHTIVAGNPARIIKQ